MYFEILLDLDIKKLINTFNILIEQQKIENEV